MDILILGGAGQVGTELQALSWPEGVRVHAPTARASTSPTRRLLRLRSMRAPTRR
ncbi:hypothetical protein MSPGM_23770 [Methylorubrum sp. GM97]|nr:hypothetical protein MSPGM_23770 [Methylorubrum sp. GM97]